MDITTAIDQRHSCRSYGDRPIEGEVLEQLLDGIRMANEESGLHMQLVTGEPKVFANFRKNYGLFRNVRNYIAMVGSRNPGSGKTVGYYGEDIVLLATRLGLGTCWVGATFERSVCRCVVEADERLYCVIAVGYEAKRKTLAARIASAAMNRKGKRLEDLCRTDRDMPDWFRNGVEAARKAPSAVNRQPVTFILDGNMVRVEVQDGPYADIELGIAKKHFELGAGCRPWA